MRIKWTTEEVAVVVVEVVATPFDFIKTMIYG